MIKCEWCGKEINPLYPNGGTIIYNNKKYCSMECSELDNGEDNE